MCMTLCRGTSFLGQITENTCVRVRVGLGVRSTPSCYHSWGTWVMRPWFDMFVDLDTKSFMLYVCSLFNGLIVVIAKKFFSRFNCFFYQLICLDMRSIALSSSCLPKHLSPCWIQVKYNLQLLMGGQVSIKSELKKPWRPEIVRFS